MEAKELRIGNLVYTSKGACVEIIINDFYIEAYHPPLFEHLKPIPLTEEWLLKAGFKLEILHHPCYTIQAHTFDWELLYVTIMENNLIHFGVLLKLPSSEVLTVGDKEYPTNQIRNLDFCFNLKYVHQLQNLYFSITGKELEFKSTT